MARVAADDDAPVLAVRGEGTAGRSRSSGAQPRRHDPGGREPGRHSPARRLAGPIGPRRVEVSTAGQPLAVLADDDGRFAFGSVPRGRAQLTVGPRRPGSGGRAVITPSSSSEPDEGGAARMTVTAAAGGAERLARRATGSRCERGAKPARGRPGGTP
jgi:hypothetical protein